MFENSTETKDTGKLIKQFEESLSAVKETCAKLEEQIAELKCAVNAQENTKSVYVPEEGDSYAFVDNDGTVNYTVNTGGRVDLQMLSFGNVFPETDNIKEHLTKYSTNVLRVQNKLMQLHELLCPDYFPDWQNGDEQKFGLAYSCDRGWITHYSYYGDSCVVRFTEKAAQEACVILNREQFKP